MNTTELSNEAMLLRVKRAMEGRAVPQLHLYYGHESEHMMRDAEIPAVNGAASAVDMLRPFFGASIGHREEMWMILMNMGNKVIGVLKISEGGIAATMCDPKLVLGAALVAQATQIVIAHNHPSGQLRPSENDRALTKKIAAGCLALDICLLDHVILTEEGFYSFADNGILY